MKCTVQWRASYFRPVKILLWGDRTGWLGVIRLQLTNSCHKDIRSCSLQIRPLTANLDRPTVPGSVTGQASGSHWHLVPPPPIISLHSPPPPVVVVWRWRLQEAPAWDFQPSEGDIQTLSLLSWFTVFASMSSLEIAPVYGKPIKDAGSELCLDIIKALNLTSYGVDGSCWPS